MGADTPAGRLKMIDLHRVWLDKAAFLGCPVCCSTRACRAREQGLTIANYQAVTALAKAKGINDGQREPERAGGRRTPRRRRRRRGRDHRWPGRATPPPPAGGPRTRGRRPTDPLGNPESLRHLRVCRLLNFPDQQDSSRASARCCPITSGLVHAGITGHLPAAMAVCRELRYTGLYSIKAIGQPGNPLDNTQKILDGVLATI